MSSSGARMRVRRPVAARPASLASVLLALLRDPPLLQVGGTRIVLREAREDRAGIGLAAEDSQCDAELQQIVRALRARLVGLVALGEGSHRVLVVATRIVRLPQPVLGIAGQYMLRIALHECPKTLLGAGIIAILQLLEGVVVELVGPACRGGRRRSRGHGRRRRSGWRGGTRRRRGTRTAAALLHLLQAEFVVRLHLLH